MSTSSKLPPVQDPLIQSLEEEVLRICEQHKEGISNQEIFDKIEIDVKDRIRVQVYNRLLNKGRLQIGRRPDPKGLKKATIVYRWTSAEDASKFYGLDESDRMVLDLILKAKENGATKRDIRFGTNLQNNTEVKSIIDRLISRKLIKEIKSIQGTNKRVYIAIQFDPSPQHTGGPWYNDEQQYDTEFIEAMYAQVLSYMKKQPHVSVDQVTNYIAEIKLSNETLSHQDIRTLMTTMLYDGSIEECDGPLEGGEYYRIARVTPAVNHLTSTPCGWCPVIKSCEPGGVISPERCLYMTEWLKESIDW